MLHALLIIQRSSPMRCKRASPKRKKDKSYFGTADSPETYGDQFGESLVSEGASNTDSYMGSPWSSPEGSPDALRRSLLHGPQVGRHVYFIK